MARIGKLSWARREKNEGVFLAKGHWVQLHIRTDWDNYRSLPLEVAKVPDGAGEVMGSQK